MDIEKINHWQKVYENKKPDEVSWTQQKPEISLDFIHSFNLSKTSAIIDIGGGDSTLVDFLLAEGFENISVLDISENALNRAKQRLGKHADKVTWINTDILEFNPAQQYDVWHDRATFHFLTNPVHVNTYQEIAGKAVNGYMIIGTFSDKGPDGCSGLEIKKYSPNQLTQQFSKYFERCNCITEDHETPFKTIQNFTFCSFKTNTIE